LAKPRQTLETPTHLVCDPLDASAIEVLAVLKLDDDAFHPSPPVSAATGSGA
jgi:hypothetical protein